MEKGRRGISGALWSVQIGLMASGLHGRKSVAVAVLRQRADIREAEMIAGDHALLRDDAVEEGAARASRLRPIRIEAREHAGIAHEQLVDAGDVALDEELLSARGHQEGHVSDGMAGRGDRLDAGRDVSAVTVLFDVLPG